MSDPVSVVREFLDYLGASDVDSAADLLSDDIVYTNVSLPTVRGRERIRRIFKAAFRAPGAAFEVYLRAITADGTTVLTERTDVLLFGPVRVQFWVCGRFDVVDGRIVLWRDYFDWFDITVATLRGLAGALVPPLRAKAPLSSAA